MGLKVADAAQIQFNERVLDVACGTGFLPAKSRYVRAHLDSSLGWFPSVRVMVEADLRGWLPVMGVVLTGEQIAAS